MIQDNQDKFIKIHSDIPNSSLSDSPDGIHKINVLL